MAPRSFTIEGENLLRAGPDFHGEPFRLPSQQFGRPTSRLFVIFAFQDIEGLNWAKTICEIERIRSHRRLPVADRRALSQA
jgi:hypothetical protein